MIIKIFIQKYKKFERLEVFFSFASRKEVGKVFLQSFISSVFVMNTHIDTRYI